jgi:hypothetical protein
VSGVGSSVSDRLEGGVRESSSTGADAMKVTRLQEAPDYDAERLVAAPPFPAAAASRA